MRFGGRKVELVISPPAGNAMIGHLVESGADGPSHYSLVLLREEDESVSICTKDFGLDLTAWAESDAVACVPLTGIRTGVLQFQFQMFESLGRDKISWRSTYIKVEDGTIHEEMSTLHRTDF